MTGGALVIDIIPVAGVVYEVRVSREQLQDAITVAESIGFAEFAQAGGKESER